MRFFVSSTSILFFFFFFFQQNIKTGKVQISAPAAFGGEDDLEGAILAEILSVEGKLAAANLGHLAADINSKFEGDL